ncbi:hypothetical protein WKW79_28945 [Variovorax robiniae]|uniref:Uncharacterized protein n=1 Tax=Variovorax robiniae TaxID=1836199 RepID=A0ABU8XFJ1_9BURK
MTARKPKQASGELGAALDAIRARAELVIVRDERCSPPRAGFFLAHEYNCSPLGVDVMSAEKVPLNLTWPNGWGKRVLL